MPTLVFTTKSLNFRDPKKNRFIHSKLVVTLAFRLNNFNVNIHYLYFINHVKKYNVSARLLLDFQLSITSQRRSKDES